MANYASYPVAAGNVITPGLAVKVVSGELAIADSTDLAIGASFESGTEGDFVSVVTSGEIYMQCGANAIAAGARVQADDDGTGIVLSAGSLTGRMLGIAVNAAVGGLVRVNVGPFDVPAGA